MTFDELIEVMEEAFGSLKLSDIARELNVTPQVVSNWKSRNQVPYKYIKELRSKINEDNNKNIDRNLKNSNIFEYDFEENASNNLDVLKIIGFCYLSIIKYKKTILITPAIFFIIVYSYFRFGQDPMYRSSARLLPTSGKSQIGGLASQLGINLGTENNDISSAKLYPDMIRSRALSKNVLDKKISLFKKDSIITMKLIDYLVPSYGNDQIENKERVKRKTQKNINSGIRKLKNILSINYSRVSPLIGIEVELNDPNVAKQIVDFVIDGLVEFQSKIKLDKIKEKRVFIENKMQDLAKDLKNSEEDLKNFRERNRIINSSPALLLIQERKQRDISILTQLYVALKKQFEQTLIEELGSSKMFIILDAAEVPLKSIGPKPKRIAMLSTFIFYFFLLTILIAGDWLYENWSDYKKKYLDFLSKR
jgi:uncharacterized protein involved in exopolysaccharide biosynthesis